MTCFSPPSAFAYPKPEEKKEGTAKPVATAVLSTTARTKAREARKEARKLNTSGGSPGKPAATDSLEAPALERVSSYLSTTSYLSMDESKVVKDEPKRKPKEPSLFQLSNPSRLTLPQMKVIALQDGQRYVPIYPKRLPGGIVVLTDRFPDMPQNVSKVSRIALGQEDEAEPPAPFEWNPSEEYGAR